MFSALFIGFLVLLAAFIVWASRSNRRIEIENRQAAWAKKGPPLLVEIHKTYFDASMAALAAGMSGEGSVPRLATLPVEKNERRGPARLVWYGEDAGKRKVELSALATPAVLCIGEETWPLLQISHLMQRVAESEEEWEYRKSLYPPTKPGAAAREPTLRPVVGTCTSCGKALRAARITGPTMRLTCRCGHENLLSKWGRCATCRALVPLEEAWLHSSYYDMKETQEWCCPRCFRHPSAPPPNQGEDDFRRGRLQNQNGQPIRQTRT
jgi:hypothetical protein